MPTLLETQRAIARDLITGEGTTAASCIVAGGLAPRARLAIYRNTLLLTVSKALRLTFPAIHRLVGADFFDGAAQLFIEAQPPASAWLDEYGKTFPDFLERFPPASSLAYLADVARLDWAVSRALHAPDTEPLDLARLAALDAQAQARIVLLPHPALSLLRAAHPADAIWRAVLAQDDAAMAAIDLDSGPVFLLVHRGAEDIDLRRLSEAQWNFLRALCEGRPLQDAIDAAPGIDPAAALAEHLRAGDFIGFDSNEDNRRPGPQQVSP
jgi:Putative DNA-binding domain